MYVLCTRQSMCKLGQAGQAVGSAFALLDAEPNPMPRYIVYILSNLLKLWILNVCMECIKKKRLTSPQQGCAATLLVWAVNWKRQVLTRDAEPGPKLRRRHLDSEAPRRTNPLRKAHPMNKVVRRLAPRNIGPRRQRS
jgi:hypothetical protein